MGPDEITNVSNKPNEQTTIQLYETYADLTARVWCNVQPGQPVLIVADQIHDKFAHKIGDRAADITGSRVDYCLIDPHANKKRILSSESIDSLKTPNENLKDISNRLVADNGAYIAIVGDEDPNFYKDLDAERRKALGDSRSLSFKATRDKISAGLMNRCVIAAPTIGWAKAIRPDLEPNEAFQFLEQSIFKMVYLDQPNPIKSFMEFDDKLEAIRDVLQKLEIDTLEFHGPGLNLSVGLSELALWLGGRKHTFDDRKIRFYANVPIGEIFTTPDARKVNGTAVLTQPLFIMGEEVSGATFTFKDGELIHFTAEKGQKALEAYFKLNTNRRLGEIALVSHDSPVSLLGLITKEILLDEKAACHFAAGDGYLACILNGAKLSDEQKAQIGYNSSLNHLDFMISNRETTVTAVTRIGQRVKILEHGLWAIN